MNKLKEVTRTREDKEAIRQYFIDKYPLNKGVAKQVYRETSGFNIFICDLYII